MRALLLLLLLLSAALPAFADPPDEPVPMPEDVHRPRTADGLKWFGEVGVGVNYTFMSPNTLYHSILTGFEPEPYTSASGLGLLTYSALGLRVSPLISIVLRGDYDQRGASRSIEVQDTGTERVTGRPLVAPVQKDYDLTINYETLSLLGELNFDDLIVYIGPSISVPVSSEFNETDAIQPTDASDLYYFDQSAAQTKTITGHAEVTDSLAARFSLKIGVGYQFEFMPKFTIVPRIGYDFGFTDALTDDVVMRMGNAERTSSENIPYFINKDFKLSSIQASIGVRFTP